MGWSSVDCYVGSSKKEGLYYGVEFSRLLGLDDEVEFSRLLRGFIKGGLGSPDGVQPTATWIHQRRRRVCIIVKQLASALSGGLVFATMVSSAAFSLQRSSLSSGLLSWAISTL
jgi:hypothetical protein